MPRALRKEIMDNVQFLHGRLEDGRRATVAMSVSPSSIHVALSVCAPEDNFSRRNGRLHATRRLAEYLRFGSSRLACSFVLSTDSHKEEIFNKIRNSKEQFFTDIFTLTN
jgi:hypothetical protein